MSAGPQREVARDVLVAAVWFVVVGVVAGVAWWQLTPDVFATRARVPTWRKAATASRIMVAGPRTRRPAAVAA